MAIAPLSFVALVLFFVWRRPRTTTPAEVWVMAAASAKTGCAFAPPLRFVSVVIRSCVWEAPEAAPIPWVSLPRATPP